MAKLYFRYGAMGSSKTANAIMVRHNYMERGQKALMIKPRAERRDGDGFVSSRSGLRCPCAYMEDLTDDMACAYHCLIVDEAQFLTPEQVRYLVRIVDDLNVPVIAYGLRADFKGDLFPGSAALLAWADTIEEIKTVCWCGKKATFNTRILDGHVVKQGVQVLLGGNESYISLCRKHWQEENLGSEIRVEKIESLEGKQAFRSLLLDADPHWGLVMAYLPKGEMYALFADGFPVCEAVLTSRADGQIELRNLATAPGHRRKGYARRLVSHLFDVCRNRYDNIYVGTAFPGLYERMGFEYAYTIPNFFIDHYPEPIFDQGRQCTDMLYFRRSLR